ncbi:MAG: hypothetical protein COT84_04755 [Chlamydiae bacterium CG10_big_fil_rev_8_21_14_0_10_35_9]|nr:MAG: hypothetical protein COT84_04755 [Chlamydiae bacterium CG10_big_fil_rev_8_21_14_0_10_35_9]
MLTKLGKYFLKKHNVSWIFLVFAAPTVLIMFFSFIEYANYARLEDKLRSLQIITSETYQKRKSRKDFLEKYFDTEQNFLSKLNNFVFLHDEVKDLQKISTQILFDVESSLSKKLERISTQNKLNFIQDKPQKYKQVQETKYCLQAPVEATLGDTFSFLNVLEKPKAPQFVIYDLELNKKENRYELNLAFLQREFFRKP